MKLCEVLKQYRWAAKLGVKDLAAEIGCSAHTLARVEHGEVPSGAVLSKVLCWLLGGQENEAGGDNAAEKS